MQSSESPLLERRKATRKKVDESPVYVFYRGKRKTKGTVTNLTPFGAFISLNNTDIAPLGAIIQTVFVVNEGNLSKTFHKLSIIVRTCNDGIGIRFLHQRKK